VHAIFLHIVVTWEIWSKRIYEKFKKSRYTLTITSKEKNKMMQKSTAFITIIRLKKCYFYYDMQKKKHFLYYHLFSINTCHSNLL
jgi:hypothetical protein